MFARNLLKSVKMTSVLSARTFRSTAISFEKSSGTVKWFNRIRGFGFLTPGDGSPDVFVHQKAILKDGFRTLQDGEMVEFIEVTTHQGRIAKRVTGLGDSKVEECILQDVTYGAQNNCV